MRFLELDSMLLLLPADKSAEQKALDRLNPLFSAHGGDAQRLPRLVQSGFLRSAQISSEGKPVAVVWYRVEDSRLIVDTVCAIAKGRTLKQAWEIIWRGVESIAKGFGCSCVEGITARAALAKVYAAHGFEARGVLMRKEICG
jgi:hypothetical protein